MFQGRAMDIANYAVEKPVFVPTFCCETSNPMHKTCRKSPDGEDNEAAEKIVQCYELATDETNKTIKRNIKKWP